MPKIGFVSNTSWSLVNFRLGIIRALKEEGHQVILIAPEDSHTEFLKKEGFVFVPLKMENHGKKPFADLKMFLLLKKIYKEYQLDFIFHYTIKPNIFGGIAAARIGVPYIPVVTGLGFIYTYRSALTRLVDWLFQLSFQKAKEVWFLNEGDASLMEEHGIVSNNKVKILPGEGVNTQYFKPLRKARPGSQLTFLYAGRLIKEKGIFDFVEAARILKEKGIQAKFQILGISEEHNPSAISDRIIKKWVSQGYIEFLGSALDVRPVLDMVDCIVLPSFYREGVPRILMEAASMEIPVIASDNVGCRRVVLDGINGFLCPSKSPSELAATMKKMLQLPSEKRKEMGERGREMVSNYFDEKIVIGIYKQTLSKFLTIKKEASASIKEKKGGRAFASKY